MASRTASRRVVAAAGAVIILISLAAALLPAFETEVGAGVVGAMMILAGSVEILTGIYRRSDRAASIAPGLVTFAAGLVFFVQPFGSILPMIWLVIGWLVARGTLLLAASAGAGTSVRRWTLIGGATDLSLAGILAAGLVAAVFPVALFGTVSEILSSFAFVLAISFIATAMLLLEVAACEFAPGE